MKYWYYVENSKTVGPVSETELDGLIDSGSVTGETLVWTKNMLQWIPAKETLLFGAPQPPKVPETGIDGSETNSNISVPDAPKKQPVPSPRVPYPAPLPQSSSGNASIPLWSKVGDLFGYVGRDDRGRLWAITISAICFWLLIASIVTNITVSPDTEAVVVVTASICSMWVFIMSLVRRLHDVNRSGIWVLLMGIPVAGLILTIVLLVQPGMDGPNQFGLEKR